MPQFRYSTLACTSDRTHREDAAHQAAVIATIERALAADGLDSGAVSSLTDRTRLPTAVAVLAARVSRRRNSVAAIFLERCSDRVRLYRLGQYFEAWKRGHGPLTITLSDLRADPRPAARLTLAAVGALPWRAASRRERVALLLHAVSRGVVP